MLNLFSVSNNYSNSTQNKKHSETSSIKHFVILAVYLIVKVYKKNHYICNLKIFKF